MSRDVAQLIGLQKLTLLNRNDFPQDKALNGCVHVQTFEIISNKRKLLMAVVMFKRLL